MLVGVISDTHVPDKARTLPKTLLDWLASVDLVLHAGDFTSPSTLELLRCLAPTEAVHGNVDDSFLKVSLPRSRVVDVGGFRVGMIHGDGAGGGTTIERARQAFHDVDCIVFGHSHYPYLEQRGSILMLNPGSPTDRRRAPRPSFALLTIDDGLRAEIVYL